MNAHATPPTWKMILILVARLIFAGVFAMAAIFKFADMNGTAGYITAAGFPFPLLLAWLAAFFEIALVLCLLTGAYFTEAALLAALRPVPGLRLPRPGALEARRSDGVRLLRQSLHLHRRTAVRGGAWTGPGARAAQQLHRADMRAPVGSIGKRNGDAIALPS
jgi:hypothetical protein